jgi:hypothetical protein
MSKSSQQSILSTWDQVLAAAQANEEDLAIVAEPRTHLEESVESLRILLSQRARLRSEIQLKTQQIRSLIDSGDDLVRRIRAGARSQYGIHSDKLRELGMTPVRRGKSRDHPGAGCDEAGAPRNPHRTVK